MYPKSAFLVVGDGRNVALQAVAIQVIARLGHPSQVVRQYITQLACRLCACHPGQMVYAVLSGHERYNAHCEMIDRPEPTSDQPRTFLLYYKSTSGPISEFLRSKTRL
jgi:hypothetical protein